MQLFFIEKTDLGCLNLYYFMSKHHQENPLMQPHFYLESNSTRKIIHLRFSESLRPIIKMTLEAFSIDNLRNKMDYCKPSSSVSAVCHFSYILKRK